MDGGNELYTQCSYFQMETEPRYHVHVPYKRVKVGYYRPNSKTPLNPYKPSGLFCGEFANSADPENATSDQGLRRLLTECSVKFEQNETCIPTTFEMDL